MAKSGDFFAKIFRHKDADHYINIFTLPARKSSYYQEPGGIPVAKLTGKQDYYYGLCTLFEPKQSGRATERDTAGVSCLWMDVDDSKFSGDTSGILASLDIIPSFCVESGGGLHAYWLLDKYNYFETQADRIWFKRIIQGWQIHVNKSFGNRLDHTHDLARILRIPGTLNHKYKPPRPVKIADGAVFTEYPIQIFEGYMTAAEGKEKKPAKEIDAVKIHRPGAMSKQISTALTNSETFNNTFHRQRPDLEDQSPSGYDFSLAIQCINLGFTDEETVNTLIAARRGAGEDTKAHRLESYYKKTLQACYKVLSDTQKEPAYTPPDDNPDENRKFLADKLGLSVSALIKHGTDDSLYKLKLSDARIIDIGPIKMLASMTSFRNRIFDAAGIYLRKLNQKNWPDILDALNSITVLERHEDEDDLAQWINWVGKYLGWVNQESKEAGLPAGKPFVENGKYYLSIGSFIDWLRINLHVKPGKYETSAMLKEIGFFGERVRARIENTDGEFETVDKSLFSIPVQHLNALQGRGDDTSDSIGGTTGTPIGKNQLV